MLDFPLFPQQASTVAREVDAIYFALVGITAFFCTLIGFLVIYFAVRYRRRSTDEVGSGPHHSTLLEVAWSVPPLFIVMFLFFWGADVFYKQRRPPADAVEYWAVGKQWMWRFQHPDGHREINDLHIPVGQPIKLTMTSEDVIHDVFIPAFRVKQDVVPGRYTTVWFEATRPGTYHLFCAEYCGTEHSLMKGRVIVMEPNEYANWLAGGGPTRPLAEVGEELFSTLACNTCHKEGDSGRGPSLRGVFGSRVELVGGRTAIADEGYLRESILDPASKVLKGYEPIMPTFRGQVGEEGILQLITYLKTLTVEDGDDVAAVAAGVDQPREEQR